MDHLLLTHSSADEHSEYASVNRVAMHVSSSFCFQFLGCITRSGIPGPYGNSMFNFLWNFNTIFHSSSTILHFYQQPEVSNFSMSFPALVVSWLFVFDKILGVCEAVSHCGFELKFPNDLFSWASFHVIIDHLCILFGKMSIEVLCQFKLYFAVAITEFRSYLYILIITSY